MNEMIDGLSALSLLVLKACFKRGLRIATAESCTGGLLAAALTEHAGASDVFERGFVTYSNAAKAEQIGVSLELILMHGAVSAEVVRAMAEGALLHSGADIAVAVTGIAGPGGGSEEKPVGLVHLGLSRHGYETRAERLLIEDAGRSAIRQEAAKQALSLVLASM